MKTAEKSYSDLLAEAAAAQTQRKREASAVFAENADKTPDTRRTKAGLLDAAKEAVADRGLNYGRPEDNFGRIAALWRTHLHNRYGAVSAGTIDAYDVAQMMILMKIARLENTPDHLDSIIDIAGYAACAAELTQKS